MTANTAPRSGSLPTRCRTRFVSIPLDGTWEAERDLLLAQFIAERLADVADTGCLAERKLAAGVMDVFTEWTTKRDLAAATDEAGLFQGQISALGWTLRVLAHSAWGNAPGWEAAFHPSAAPPARTLENAP
ncbi:hypothetical protein [Streptomyces sp. NPDC047525]|uniref:hypothetical protein n=1 Tax=Streptomyces sp. NPDC047525 TaxID=3155264 RepID=UPI0033D49BBD